MMSKFSLVGLLFAALVLPAGCAKPPQEASTPAADPKAVVARYVGGVVLRGDISEAVARRLAEVAGPVSAETRQLIVRKVIERQVRIATLAAEAESRGYAASAEAAFRTRAAEERVLAADLVATEVSSAKATDAMVAAAVESRLQALRPEEARKFSHIFLRAPQEDAAARAQAAARMKEILAALETGTGFNTLAERYSNSVMARGGGRIEWTRRKDLQPAAGDVVFALGEGQVSPVVETKDGLHLFRIDGIRSGAPIDVELVRRSTRTELDAEAASVAERALRQRALDAAGAEFVSAARLQDSAQPASGWVARFRDQEIRREEYLALTARMPPGVVKPERFLRELVENRLLAEKRRAAPIPPQLESQLEAARDQAVLSSYRALLVAGIDTGVTSEEIAKFYRENAQSALFLREYHADLIYFPQTGDSVAESYAAGEGVIAKLREGTSFDALLDQAAAGGARICRDAHPVDLEGLGESFLRLRKALLNLDVGGVSPALYFDGPGSSVVPGVCVLEGRGVVFARLRKIGTLPLELASELVRRYLVEDKERAGVEAIQARLVADSKLEILLPEG